MSVRNKKFDYSLDFKNIDMRKSPELYVIGRGEQGVLSVEPYKSEILPFWRFKDPDIAKKSSTKIVELFNEYLKQGDFIGADMARKFLQMGYTRARRYANFKGGRKYKGPVPNDKKGQSGAHGREEFARGPEDPVKAKAAKIFKDAWDLASQHTKYLKLREQFIEDYY